MKTRRVCEIGEWVERKKFFYLYLLILPFLFQLLSKVTLITSHVLAPPLLCYPALALLFSPPAFSPLYS